MKRLVLFNVWKTTKTTNFCEKMSEHLINTFRLDTLDEDTKKKKKIKNFIKTLASHFKKRWAKSNRILNLFLKKNSSWLDEDISIPFDTNLNQISNPKGRPPKPIRSCTPRVQRRKVKGILKNFSPDEIMVAAQVHTHAEGKRDAAKIINELSNSSPQRATHLKKARKSFNEKKDVITTERALAIIVNNKMTSRQYKNIRLETKKIGRNIFPAYQHIKEEKMKCYPPETSIKITECSAEVDLQQLLDITTKRLCIVQEDVILSYPNITVKTITLLCKWGCDGSSNQSRYKQKLNSDVTDENLFTISFVPLRLIAGEQEKSLDIIWKNPRPNSTRYCRVVKFCYMKETDKVIKEETNKIKQQIDRLTPVNIKIGDIELKIHFKLLLTMIDGKVCSSLSTFSSSQVCYICGATPKQMNNMKELDNRLPLQDMYAFGLSPLHALIRCMEFLLHLSYKLQIKKWQAKSSEEKQSVSSRKKCIQKQFKEVLGLIIDVPKQTSGNSNDGNTARRFFENPEITGRITEIDINLIHRFKIILQCLCSGFKINISKFAEYTNETKDLYLSKYVWYYMPASIHKILVHGREIITSCIVPLGELSEEAQEARNKDYRQYRANFSRKNSRVNTNRDILNRFLISSDPVLSSYAPSVKKRSGFHTDMLKLIECEVTESSSSESEDESDSDD